MFSFITEILGLNNCSICSDVIFSNPIEIQCGHMCHKECAREYFRRHTNCPECKERVSHSYYFFKITNPMLDEMLEIFKEIQKLNIKIIEENEGDINEIFKNLLKVVKYYNKIKNTDSFITRKVAMITSNEIITTYRQLYKVYTQNFIYYSKYKYCVWEDKQKEYKKMKDFMEIFLKRGRKINSLAIKSKYY